MSLLCDNHPLNGKFDSAKIDFTQLAQKHFGLHMP